MKNLSLVLILFILLASKKTYCQVEVQKLSFDKALQKVKDSNKLLMVVMDDTFYTANNSTTTKALSDSDISDVNKIAIVIRPDLGGEDWKMLSKKYYTFSAMGTLFFNPQGVLVHRYDAINPHGYAYLVQANAAFVYLNLPTEDEQLADWRKSGFKDISLLKKLIDTRKKANESFDDLLQPFIDNTPIDSIDNYKYFYILARFSPVLSSKADSFLRNRSSFNENWYQIEISERRSINKDIIKKTMNSAVTNKNDILAKQVADFAANTLSINSDRLRSKYRTDLLTDFYYRTNDTLEFIRSAITFMDNYYMNLSIDSLKNFYINKEKDSARMGGNITIYANGATSKNLPYFSEFRLIGDRLNHHAWAFYTMTKDSLIRLKALGWAKRSLEFNLDPHTMDTYARLLYVTGDRKKGITEEKEALVQYKKAKLEKSIPEIERTLSRMKNGDEKIDD